MSLLVKPRFWVPSAAKVDPKWSWAWRDLAFLFPILKGTGSLVDHGPSRKDAIVGTQPDLGEVLSDVGPAKLLDGTNEHHFRIPDRADFRFEEGKTWSIACAFMLTTGGTAMDLLSKWPASSPQRQWKLAIDSGAAPNRIEIHHGGTGVEYQSARFLVVNVPFLVVVTNNGGTLDTAKVYIAILETGDMRENGAVVDFNGDASNLTGDITFGGRANFIGHYMMAAGWLRELTTTEVSMMALDPWGMFRPVKRAVGFVAAAPTPSHEYLYVHKRSTMNRILAR